MPSDHIQRLRYAIVSALVPLAGCTPIDRPAQPTPIDQSTKTDTPPKPEKQPPVPQEKLACAGDQALVDANQRPTGYSKCEDGSVHRSEAVACQIPPILQNACPGGDKSEGPCTTDADCTDKPYGRCITYERGMMRPSDKVWCGCHYACESDNDCEANQACLCTGALSLKSGHADDRLPRCVPASCRTDADCGSGECGAAIYFNGCSENATLACRGEGDSCRSHDSCDGDNSCVAMVQNPGSLQERHDWQCQGMSCMIGRPFLVAGQARVAALSEGGGTWHTQVAECTSDPQLAEYWQRIAELEHASVASFARFIDQLLALGAPPQLLSQARAALADEVRHTKLCLQMSQRFGGGQSPGRFDLRGAQMGPVGRVSVACQLFDEACLGETIGVCHAHESYRMARDPESREVYRQIAGDEQRHAQLAWQTFKWLVDTATPSQRREILGYATRRLQEAEHTLQATHAHVTPARPEFGLLGPSLEQHLSLVSLREVIAPALDHVSASIHAST